MRTDYVSREHIAEKVIPQHLHSLVSLSHRLSNNIAILAPLDYALNKIKSYLEGSSKSGINMEKVLCYIFLVITGLMISRAPYAALSGIPDSWRWGLAIGISIVLVCLMDWSISTFNTSKKCAEDAQKDQKEINAYYQKAKESKNILIKERADAYQKVFNFAKSAYKHPHNIGLIIFPSCLLIVEYVASLYYIKIQGDEIDILTFIVPFLGVFLSPLEALYKVSVITYPNARRKISSKYKQFADKFRQEESNQLLIAVEEFDILEGLTNFVINHLNSTAEERDLIENELVKKREIGKLNSELAQLELKHRQLTESLIKEIEPRYYEITDISMLQQETLRKLGAINQECNMEYEQLKRRSELLNYTLPTPYWQSNNQNGIHYYLPPGNP